MGGERGGGLRKLTNTLQAANKHSNTHQCAEGTVADFRNRFHCIAKSVYIYMDTHRYGYVSHAYIFVYTQVRLFTNASQVHLFLPVRIGTRPQRDGWMDQATVYRYEPNCLNVAIMYRFPCSCIPIYEHIHICIHVYTCVRIPKHTSSSAPLWMYNYTHVFDAASRSLSQEGAPQCRLPPPDDSRSVHMYVYTHVGVYTNDIHRGCILMWFM